MSEKIIGYLLLVSGIIIIIVSAFSVYSVFTKQSGPIQLFNFPAISLDASQLVSGGLSSMLKQNQKIDLMSADMINQTSNILAHLMLMGFLANIGYRIASLGTMMVRPIKVKLKEEQISTANATPIHI